VLIYGTRRLGSTGGGGGGGNWKAVRVEE